MTDEIDTLDRLGNETVVDPRRFPWAGGPLLDMADECSGKHYDWGLERIGLALS